MRSGRAWLVFAALGAVMLTAHGGCNWIARYTSGAGADVGDVGDAPRDAAGDADVGVEVNDMALDADARRVDLDIAALCGAASRALVAHYRFDVPTDGTIVNSLDIAPPGKMVGPFDAGLYAYVDGRCGSALAFRPGDGSFAFGFVAASPVWKLRRGSIDFWIRIQPADAARAMGILSRDKQNQVIGGHLTVRHFLQSDAGPGINLRVQGEGFSGGSQTSCGVSVADGTWHHIAINFGDTDTELYVDGQLQPSRLNNCGGTAPPLTVGINANDLPWILGAHTIQQRDGGIAPRDPFYGEIDELRVSRERRDFGAYRSSP